MRWYVPLIVAPGSEENPDFFLLTTNVGRVLLVFGDRENLSGLISIATPIAQGIGHAMAYAEVDAKTRDEVRERLSIDAQIVFDDDPQFEQLMRGFAASQTKEHDKVADERQLYDAFWEVLTAETWSAMRKRIEAHPELMTRRSEELIETFSAATRKQNDDTAPIFEEVARTLRTVRSRGIDAAFAGKRPDDDPAAAFRLEQLEPMISPGGELGDFLRTGSVEALRIGIATLDRLLRHPRFGEAKPDLRAEILQNGAELYFSRSQNGGAPSDLDRAVELADRALSVRPVPTSRRARCLSVLGIALSARYEQVAARREDLERAIASLEESIALTGKSDAARPTYLSNLAVALHERFKLDGERRDLDRGIAFLEEAATRAEPKSVELTRAYTNLCLLLNARAFTIGSRAEMERAIEIGKRAVQAAQSQRPLLVTALLNLSEALHTEYVRFSERARLDESLTMLESARSLATGFSRAYILSRLGPRYRARFGWSADRDDLEKAVEALEEAVRLTPAGSTHRAEMVSSLIEGLLHLAQQIGGIVVKSGEEIRFGSTPPPTEAEKARCATMLQRAIELAEQVAAAANATSQAEALESVASAYLVRMSSYARQDDDSKRAFRALRAALEQTPEGSPEWSRRVVRLATLFEEAPQDIQQQLDEAYEQVIAHELETRVEMAHAHANAWSWRKFSHQQWAEAERPFELLLEARRRLIEVQFAREHKETWIGVLQEEVHRAAYAFAKNGNLRAAVLALENGRAHVLTSALLRDRADLAALASSHPQLHRRYVDAATRLATIEREELRRDALPPAAVAGARASREELEAALQEIRRVRGFERFLMPVTFEDIERAIDAAGASAIVYLTTTHIGSLALIVAARSIEAVWSDLDTEALDELLTGGYLAAQSGQDVDLSAILARILPRIREQLEPVAQRLHAIGSRTVVLIPTGKLGALPLHAALLDDFDVAFAPNARVLALAPRKRIEHPTFLGIGDPWPHPFPIPAAELEVAAIAERFDRAFLLIRALATKQAVLEQMPVATHLHFACHGTFDSESPLDSSLELGGGERLRLRDLLDRRDAFANARLVALSACQSAVTESRRLHDEFIGLPAAFLQAGVPGVAGSLWLVDDVATALLMIRFYEHPSRDERPAAALCAAQRWLRDLGAAELQELLRQYEIEPGREIEERPFADPWYWAAFAFFGA